MQMGFESTIFKKLHSFLVAAEAACSKGDLPVAAVEARLAAVPGLATAAVPTALAADVPELLSTAIGAAHADKNTSAAHKPIQRKARVCKYRELLATTGSIKNARSPRTIWNSFKNTLRSFLICNDFPFTAIAGKYFELNRAVFARTAIIFIEANN